MLKYLFNPYSLAILFFIAFLSLQYELWLGEGGIKDISRLNEAIAKTEQKNIVIENQNHALQANINDLKNGQDASEEVARSELGMIKPDETYYQIIGNNNKQ